MTLTFPIHGLRLVSELNVREHWGARSRRAKRQRDLVTLVCRRTVSPALLLDGPLLVTLTRIAPRRLDDDNATASGKHVRDAVAALLGIDDRDPRVTWRVEQQSGRYGIRITVGPRPVQDRTREMPSGVVLAGD